MRHRSASQTEASRLRLVGRGPNGSLTMRFTPSDSAIAGGAEPAVSDRAKAEPTTGLEPTDPRWVLAVRTQQVLQGAVLRPGDRQELLRVGKVMGLNPFDANLVIAIVQDQARRGGDLQRAADSLSRVPLRQPVERSPIAWRVVRWCAAAVAAELLIIWAII